MIDFVVQALAAGLLFYGVWEMGNVRIRGPIAACVAELFTIAVGIMHDTWSIVLIGVVLMLVQARVIWKWRKEGNPL